MRLTDRTVTSNNPKLEEGKTDAIFFDDAISGFGLRVRHRIQSALGVAQVLGHEDHQDRIDAIIAEALGRFVPHDVRHPGRHPLRFDGRR